MQRHMMTVEQQQELTQFINRHSLENGCDMPDFAIAGYLAQCYQALCIAAESKVDWSNVRPHDCEYDDPRMCAWPGHRLNRHLT
jgi:hypothetical protein